MQLLGRLKSDKTSSPDSPCCKFAFMEGKRKAEEEYETSDGKLRFKLDCRDREITDLKVQLAAFKGDPDAISKLNQ